MKKTLLTLLAGVSLFSDAAYAKKPKIATEIKKEEAPIPAGTLDPYILRNWTEEFLNRPFLNYLLEAHEEALSYEREKRGDPNFYTFNFASFFEFDEVNKSIKVFANTFPRSFSFYKSRIDFLNYNACENEELKERLERIRKADYEIGMGTADESLLREIYALTNKPSECTWNKNDEKRIVIYYVGGASYFSGVFSGVNTERKKEQGLNFEEGILEMNPVFITEWGRYSYQTTPVIRVDFTKAHDIPTVELELFFEVPETTQEEIRTLIGRGDFRKIDEKFYSELTNYPRTEIIDHHRDGINVTYQNFSEFQEGYDSLCITPRSQTSLCHEFAKTGQQAWVLFRTTDVSTEIKNDFSTDFWLRKRTLAAYVAKVQKIYDGIYETKETMTYPIFQSVITENQKLKEEIEANREGYENLLETRVEAKNPFGTYMPKE